MSSSILPYYFFSEIGIEQVCEKEDTDTEKKEGEKKEKIRDNFDGAEYVFSKKDIKYYNFKNFHHTHFQEIETPPPEFPA